MLNLLKADLYRIIKSKLTIIIICISVGLAFLSSLIYYGLFQAAGEDSASLAAMINGRYLFAAAFSPTSTIGLIIPIFSCILIGNDVSSGVMRNKIITGSKRRNIYLANYLSGVIFNVVMITIYSLSSLLISSLLIGFGTDFTAKQFGLLCKIYLIGIITYAFIASVSVFLSVNLGKAGISTIIQIAFIIILSVLCSLEGLIVVAKLPEWTHIFFRFIPLYGISEAISNYGGLTRY